MPKKSFAMFVVVLTPFVTKFFGIVNFRKMFGNALLERANAFAQLIGRLMSQRFFRK